MGKYVTGLLDPNTLPPRLRLPSADGPRQGDVGSEFSSSDCGSVTGTAAGPALMPNAGMLAINGQTYLNGCIVGNDTAAVQFILVSANLPDSEFAYCVLVNGSGPSGFGSGSLHLLFTDQTNDTYALKLFLSEITWHHVQYNSTAPGIVSVSWSS